MRPSAGLSRAEERWMTDTATIWRSVSTPDGAGGNTVAWSSDGTTPCQILVASQSERQAAAQQGVDISHTVKVPLETDVSRGDRLVVDGLTAEVVTVETGTHVTVKRVQARQEPWDEPTA